MLIDFKEIAQGNVANGLQDSFELFARDFLEEIGFNVLWHPDRGADGKKDIIVNEIRKGIAGETVFKWLVSCKHYAHSGKSISNSDEQDIDDRVKSHSCNGFMGVYSTIPATSLNNKLNGLGIEYQIYDREQIEKKLLQSRKSEKLILRYFPNSYLKYKELDFHDKTKSSKPKTYQLKREDLIEAARTAVTLVEIQKLREEYFGTSWTTKSVTINKLYKFSDFSNIEIASEALRLLYDAANETRGNMPPDIGLAIESLVISFFPPFKSKVDEDESIDLAILSANTGFSLAYDSVVYLDNLMIAAYGLSIIKYIYRYGKKQKVPRIIKEVHSLYSQLESTESRWRKESLPIIFEFLKVFKEDLETKQLAFPPMPDHIFSYMTGTK